MWTFSIKGCKASTSASRLTMLRWEATPLRQDRRGRPAVPGRPPRACASDQGSDRTARWAGGRSEDVGGVRGTVPATQAGERSRRLALRGIVGAQRGDRRHEGGGEAEHCRAADALRSNRGRGGHALGTPTLSPRRAADSGQPPTGELTRGTLEPPGRGQASRVHPPGRARKQAVIPLGPVCGTPALLFPTTAAIGSEVGFNYAALRGLERGGWRRAISRAHARRHHAMPT